MFVWDGCLNIYLLAAIYPLMNLEITCNDIYFLERFSSTPIRLEAPLFAHSDVRPLVSWRPCLVFYLEHSPFIGTPPGDAEDKTSRDVIS